MQKNEKNFLGPNGLVSAPTFSKSSQHTIMILYSRIFAFFCIALDALRTYVKSQQKNEDREKHDGLNFPLKQLRFTSTTEVLGIRKTGTAITYWELFSIDLCFVCTKHLISSLNFAFSESFLSNSCSSLPALTFIY